MEDYKEKYEQLIKFIKDLYPFMSYYCKEKAEGMIPELKESDDDRIKTNIIKLLRFVRDTNHQYSDECNESIAWLEKQGKVKHTCRNCQTFQDLHQNCPYSPIYQYTDLTDAHKHLDDETHCEFWLEKQGEQKPTCLLDNSMSKVKFPFKAKVKSNGKIITIHDGQLGMDCKDWVEYQSDAEDGYRVYKPEDLELIYTIEPKFKVGDWINKDGTIWRIEGVNGKEYVLRSRCDIIIREHIHIIDSEFHLWTIQDAKDGDILCYRNDIFLVKSYVLFNKVISHCTYSKRFIPHNIYSFTREDFNKIYPAIKEQQDFLFQKMKEIGYEWNAEKKELKEIEQKPAWSEDDEKLLNLSLENLTELKNRFGEKYGKVGDCISWIKSLKERIKS